MDIINISSWNVHGKGSPEEVDKILSYTSKSKCEQQTPHIVCVQEANLPSSGEELLNYKWLCLGKFGSAVLINKASTLKAGLFEQVCEQICVAEVVTDLEVVIKVISCYIPSSTDYFTRDLWLKLEEVIKKIPGNVIYVLAGDFNAEIGKEDHCPSGIYRGVIGPKLCHKISNENGMQLKKLAVNFHATITTTFGENISKEPFYTFKDGKEKSQRSFILVPSDRVPYPSKTLLQDCKLTWDPDYQSAVLSKSLRFTLYEKLSNLISSPVVVSCWNVQGASPSVVDKALSELDLPVVCVQNVFLTSDDDGKTNNYTWFTSKKLWFKNVGILIKSGSNISMADFEVVSESLCAGNVTVNGCKIKVVCCSLPLHTDLVRFQEVTTKLMDLVKNIPEETLFVVAGDFNTHVTYTILDDTLVFDEGDENALYLQKLMKECNMEMPYIPKSSVTQVSEKVDRNSSFVLMSPSCMLKYSHRHIIRWVPFFENGVVTLYLSESDLEQDRFLLTSPNSEIKGKELSPGKVEHVGGLVYVTKKFCRMKRYLSITTIEQQAYRFISSDVAKQKSVEKTDLPEEIVIKYKNSPPPLDELLRILGNGFTLYHGFMQESSVPKGFVSVLTASFEYLNRGALLAECIDVLEEKTKEPVKRIIKFRWNGIVVHEQEGGKFISYKRIINKGQLVLISSLGQHYFTVKARESFYNNGLPPLCQDKDKLNKLMSVVKREDFPSSATVEDLKLHINNFFAGNPQGELVFGPDFSYHKFLEPIKRYVMSKNLGTRVFKSRKDLEYYDHVSVFVNHSPQKLCKMLILTPEHQDLRFQLIPPSGTDKDYFDWITQWAEKPIPEEYYKPYEKSIMEYEPIVAPSRANKEYYIKPANLEGRKTQKDKRNVGFVHKDVVHLGNQLQHKITRCSNLMSGNPTVWMPKGLKDWVKIAREQSDLPKDVVDKYCETPLPDQDLRRVLGDNFTLYYGFGRISYVVSTAMEVLAESFEALDRGGVMLEYVEILNKGRHCNRAIKFKWNGICIHQEEGSVYDSFKNISQKGQTALIDKLGQHFYTVRAKMSYYKGTLPLCSDKEKLSEALRMVKKSEFPSSVQTEDVQIDDVKKFISDFFNKDSDVELVFGPEFSRNEVLEPLRKFAMDKDLGYRLLKSSEDVPNWDSVGLFVKRSPLEVRDRLMQIPDHQDLRFFLVPPSEFFNKSHYEWIKSWAAENYFEEFKLILEKEKTVEPSAAIQQNKKTQQSSAPKKLQRQQMDKRREKSRSQPTTSAGGNQQLRQQADYRGENLWSLLSRTADRNQQEWRLEDYYKEVTYPQLSRSDDRDISNWLGNQDASSDRVAQKRDWRHLDYYGDYSRSQPSVSDDYADYRSRNQGRIEVPDDYADYRSRNQGRNEVPDDYAGYRSGSQGRNKVPDDFADYRSGNQGLNKVPDDYADYRSGNQGRNEVPERYVPESKRARKQTSSRVVKPRWDDLAPLVIVWPVSIRSEQEKDPRKVLEANFPTEVSLEANNRVAVHVTLPLRNRRDKTYCLCVGDGVYKATKTALDMIVKRSSVIKHTVNFLPPDGLVPNFIRYNIPCQTNPRTYIMLSWMDTGPLTREKIIELFDSFKYSLNEDLFFDKEYYSQEMKQMLLDLAPNYGLKVRHFGTDHRLVDRYVCVYKTKPKEAVLEEVLKMRDLHPKYRLVTNKLPPRLGLNIF